MAPNTQLGTGGYPVPFVPVSAFTGKPASGGKIYTTTFTELGPGGYSKPFVPISAFSGKTPSHSGTSEWLIRARRRGRR